jgi:hypothetical protein
MIPPQRESSLVWSGPGVKNRCCYSTLTTEYILGVFRDNAERCRLDWAGLGFTTMYVHNTYLLLPSQATLS